VTPERLLTAAMYNVVNTTNNDWKKVGDYLKTRLESYTRFAWLPKQMSNKKIIWLRKYIEVRHYADIFDMPSMQSHYYVTLWTPEDHLMNTLKNDNL